jgi:hypothetical protein
LHWIFSRTVCPGLALNLNPPDLCLLSSWDYRCETPAPDLPTISEGWCAMQNKSNFPTAGQKLSHLRKPGGGGCRAMGASQPGQQGPVDLCPLPGPGPKATCPPAPSRGFGKEYLSPWRDFHDI